MTYRFFAKVVSESFGYEDDSCITTIRCNGRLFHIEIAPAYFHNSPLVSSRYGTFLSALKEEGEFAYDEEKERNGQSREPEIETDAFHSWLIAVFVPLFQVYAPDVPPSFDPDQIRSGDARPLLSEYVVPDEHRCRLEAKDGQAVPVYQRAEMGPVPQPNRVGEGHVLVTALRPYVPIVPATEIEVDFPNPEDATSQMPTRVRADVGKTGQLSTTCFCKLFETGLEGSLARELQGHLHVLQSGLAPDVRVVRLLGLVWVDDSPGKGRVGGLLLTYVGDAWHALLENKAFHATPSQKQQWADQIQETVRKLHDAGVVWGDAKMDNVMVDEDGNAWLVDLGGGYTEGWVDKDKAGTRKGDLQGTQKIVSYLTV